MLDRFYRQFEERHRGPRHEIRQRLSAYLPFITPLRELDPTAKALDLGCGRGEWLETLADVGFDATGVDLDAGMLQACHDRGLNVIKADALEVLARQPDESLVLISAFHLVEHIAFGELSELVGQAQRALMPGGLLILETPNPENLVVGTCNFYTDPTHNKPIPPTLLAFLPEYHGFGRVKIVRTNGSLELTEQKPLQIADVLGGVSPDYAVVAQKPTANGQSCQIDAFEGSYGVDLGSLAMAYDQRLAQQFEHLYATVEQLSQTVARQEAILQRTLTVKRRLRHSWLGRFIAWFYRPRN